MKKPPTWASLCRLMLGVVPTILGLALYPSESHLGVGASIVFSLFFTLGLRWLILGIMGFVKPIPERKKSYGIAVAAAVALGVIGPSVSSTYHRSKEPVAWETVLLSEDEMIWNQEYEKVIAEPFRRPEFLSRYCEVICKQALRDQNYEKLRYQAEQVFGAKTELYDEKAKETLRKSYHELFSQGLKSLKPSKQADPKLVSALTKALTAISEKPTRKIYFHYISKGSLAGLNEDKAYLAQGDPATAKLPILAVGEAFSDSAQQKRAQEVQASLQASLDAVWPKGLISLQQANAEPNPDDVHFWIEADIHRLPGFYVNSTNNVPDSLLYRCEVAWRFRTVIDGKDAGVSVFKSEPAKQVSYTLRDQDPEWAAYSIIMDSASDSFANLIVARLGMTPPKPKEGYTFGEVQAASPSPTPTAK